MTTEADCGDEKAILRKKERYYNPAITRGIYLCILSSVSPAHRNAKTNWPGKISEPSWVYRTSPDHMNSPLDNSERKKRIRGIENEAHQCHHEDP